jgi:hypothetical protein
MIYSVYQEILIFFAVIIPVISGGFLAEWIFKKIIFKDNKHD